MALNAAIIPAESSAIVVIDLILGMSVPLRPRSGRGLDKFLRLWYNHQ